MKKLFSILMMMAVATASHAQQNETKLTQLDNYLQQHGFRTTYLQEVYEAGTVHHRWMSYSNVVVLAPEFDPDYNVSEEEKQRVIHEYDSINALRRQQWVESLQTIRDTYSQLSKEASQSYMYEYHQNNTDSIMYSIAFARDKFGELSKSNINNQVYFGNTKEDANFTYSNTFNPEYNGNVEQGIFNHALMEEVSLQPKDTKPFDVTAFESFIQPVLDPVMKLKGVKTFPIHWQHDEGFPETDDFYSRARYAQDQHWGITTGKCIFIPVKYKSQFNDIYHQLDSLSKAYVDNHPEQMYRYLTDNQLMAWNVIEMITGTLKRNQGDTEYYHFSYSAKDEGLYLMMTNTKGERWIPDDWQKLKSQINSERIYRK
jgi:hypothetical protein